MPASIDLTGHVYGRLTVVRLHGRRTTPSGHTYKVWECLCECGNTAVVSGGSLRQGTTIACGCAHRDAVTTHGLRSKPEYEVWRLMLRRCEDPSFTGYRYYGGRGITVCDRWRDLHAFIEDMGPRPSKTHSIDRIDGNKGYEPGNCHWATKTEQCRNRSMTVWIERDGKKMTLKEAAEDAGLDPSLVYARKHKGEPQDAWFRPNGVRLKRFYA